MPVNLTIENLLDYTAWERQTWHGWLTQHGDHILELSAGPHGDGRFQTIGDLIRHIVSAEIRYVERLSNKPLTEAASIPNHSVEALFRFGQQSRVALQDLVQAIPEQDWDVPRNFKILSYDVRATPRKIVIHVLMHEIRHWAQIATLLRLEGLTAGFHDFLMSPVLD